MAAIFNFFFLGSEFRIIGGDDVDITKVPYQLSLRYYGQHVCGAAILSPTVGITAAHCFPKQGAYSVKAGVTKLNEPGVVVHVHKALIHPKYSSDSNDYDVAILFLSSSLPSNDHIQPIELPPSGANAQIHEGMIGRVTGWGVTRHGSKQHYNNELKGVELPVWEWSKCKDLYVNITENSFCAGYQRGWRDTCLGDSGGPYVVDKVLYGLLSAGTSCAQPGNPGVYTNLQVLKNFIVENGGL